MSDRAASGPQLPAALRDPVLRRRRDLAGESRAGRWARGRARAAQAVFVRRQWWRLLVGLAVMLVPSLTVTALLMPAGMKGFAAGAECSAAVALLALWVVLASGSGPTMMGATAEQWTAAELRGLDPHEWRLVNHLVLTADGDIDHVLVGPGGVYVVETKWSGHGWDQPWAHAHIDAGAQQVAARARRLWRWENVKRLAVPTVTPVLVLWGPGAPAAHRHHTGTLIIPGPALAAWRTSLPAGELTPGQVDALWCVFDNRVRVVDEARRA